MRYTAVTDTGGFAPNIGMPDIFLRRVDNRVVGYWEALGYQNNRLSYDIDFEDKATGICIGDSGYDRNLFRYTMYIPETHPYFNYGLLLRNMLTEINLSSEVKILDAVKDLFEEIKIKVNV